MKPLLFWVLSLFCFSASAYETIWVDVRTAQEYSTSHVSGALNIPYQGILEGIQALNADKNQVIYLYCRSGNRSGKAKKMLDEAGYLQVVNLGGLEEAQQHYEDVMSRSEQSLKEVDSELFQ